MADTGTPLFLTYLEPDQGEADVVFNGNMDVLNDGFAATADALLRVNNLSDLLDVPLARTNLGLGSGDSPTFAGLTVDSPTLVVDATNNRVGVGTTTPGEVLHVVGGNIWSEYAGNNNDSSSLYFRKARGATGAPANVTGTEVYATLGATPYVAGDYRYSGSWAIRGDGAPVGTVAPIRHIFDGYDTAGTYIPALLSLRANGNIGLGTNTFGTSATKVVALLGPGTAPTTSPADTVQLWAADRGATAGKGSLFLRTEDGTSHVLGDLVGMGTLLTATLGSGAAYQALNVRGSALYVGQSSVQERAQAFVNASWVVSTDATRTARLTLSTYDATAAREGLRIETSGTAALIGFLGATAVVRQTLPAAATDAATTQALANSLRTALMNLGLAS
jgi:hypothetical protein